MKAFWWKCLHQFSEAFGLINRWLLLLLKLEAFNVIARLVKLVGILKSDWTFEV